MAKKQKPIERNVTWTFKDGEGDPKTERHFKIQFDFTYQGAPKKAMDPKTVTVPDMEVKVHQLLEDHTLQSNGKVKIQKPFYFGHTIPNIYDMTDVERYREHLREQGELTEKWMADAKAAKEQAEKDAKKAEEKGESSPPKKVSKKEFQDKSPEESPSADDI